MLTKLLRYEFKATARLFLPFYLVLIIFVLINRFLSFDLLSRLESLEPPFGIAGALGSLVLLLRAAYFVLIVGVIVATLLIMIQRFYRSLLGDEGFLMFTLPVFSWQHIVSKLITAATWTIASGLVTVGSIVIFVAKSNPWPTLWVGINIFRDTFGVTGLFVFPLAILSTMISGILMIYAAITLGHLASRHRLLASLAWYAALNFATKISLLAILLTHARAYWQGIADAATDAMWISLAAVWYCLLPAIILGAFYFALTNYILERRLNLG